MTSPQPISNVVSLKPRARNHVAANLYARAGFRVTPLHDVSSGACSCGKPTCVKSAGKHPRLVEWQKSASSDPAVIATWWTKWPNANVGLVSDDFLALDVDPRNGGRESLALRTAKHGDFSLTPPQP